MNPSMTFANRSQTPFSGLEFIEGVLSTSDHDQNFHLISPEGERYQLNPALNRQSLIHLNHQPVRALLRCPSWPRLVGRKPCHDVLFVERLRETLDLSALDECIPSLATEDVDFEDRWSHGARNRVTDHPDYQSSLTF